MPSCNPFNLSHLFSVPSQRPITCRWENGVLQWKQRAGYGLGPSAAMDTALSLFSARYGERIVYCGQFIEGQFPKDWMFSTNATYETASTPTISFSEQTPTTIKTKQARDGTRSDSKRTARKVIPTVRKTPTSGAEPASALAAESEERQPDTAHSSTFHNFHRVTSYSRKALVISDVLNRAQRGVLRYLERAESKEGDVWYAQDYRLAQHVVTLSDEGVGNPYAVAFLHTYGRPAEKITWWWRDRSALMRLAEACGSNTPLLHADQAETVLGIVPDFDYSQVSPATRQAHAKATEGDSYADQRTEAQGCCAAMGGSQWNSDSVAPGLTGALPPKKPALSATQNVDRPGSAGDRKAL